MNIYIQPFLTQWNKRLLAILVLVVIVWLYATPVLAYIGLGDVTGTGAGYNEEKLIATGVIASLFISDDGDGPLVVGPYGAGPAPPAPAPTDAGTQMMNQLLTLVIAACVIVAVWLMGSSGNWVAAILLGIIGLVGVAVVRSMLGL